MEFGHVPVLFDEVMEALAVKPAARMLTVLSEAEDIPRAYAKGSREADIW